MRPKIRWPERAGISSRPLLQRGRSPIHIEKVKAPQALQRRRHRGSGRSGHEQFVVQRLGPPDSDDAVTGIPDGEASPNVAARHCHVRQPQPVEQVSAVGVQDEQIRMEDPVLVPFGDRRVLDDVDPAVGELGETERMARQSPALPGTLADLRVVAGQDGGAGASRRFGVPAEMMMPSPASSGAQESLKNSARSLAPFLSTSSTWTRALSRS